MINATVTKVHATELRITPLEPHRIQAIAYDWSYQFQIHFGKRENEFRIFYKYLGGDHDGTLLCKDGDVTVVHGNYSFEVNLRSYSSCKELVGIFTQMSPTCPITITMNTYTKNVERILLGCPPR